MGDDPFYRIELGEVFENYKKNFFLIAEEEEEEEGSLIDVLALRKARLNYDTTLFLFSNDDLPGDY